MVTKRLHIRILTLLLLLLIGGMGNEAWAKKITYHILTKPFDVRSYNNQGFYKQYIRVEALQCTSEESTVGLPDQFKSPLAKGFRYWKTATSTYDLLYHSNNGDSNTKIIATKCYIYQCTAGDAYACLSNEIDPAETSTNDEGFPNDIYVTYDYINDGEAPGWKNNILELDGETHYNVAITNSNKQKFLCYNRSRNNRVANALGSGLSGEDLANDDFVTPVNDKKQLGWNWSKWGPVGVFMGFKFTGQDPYNFTITTSYAGEELHITDAISNVDNTGTIKPYAGATLMAKIGANSLWFDCSNDRHYKLKSGIKDAGQWTAAKYAECKTTYYATAEAARYDTWVGFYRYESPTLNTFCLLPHPGGDGYMFVGSKMNQGDKNSTKPTINQPNNGQYYTYYDYYDNDGGGRSQPYFRRWALSNAHPTKFYEIRTYTLKLKTHGSSTVLTKDIKWSDAMASERIVDHVPDALKRKYVLFTGAYSDESLSASITTFADALAANNGNVIWLKYETDTEASPFEFLPEGGSYTNAHWYTMRVNGKEEQKNIAYNSTNNFITGDPSIGSESDLHQGENSSDAMVAFMGDPYELKIISRATSEAATANRYVGCATGAADNTTLNTDKTGSSDISTWEIMYESTDAGNFVLRQFNTVDSPKYIDWSTTSNRPLTYSSDSTRIRVVDLDKVNYTYHIMRLDGTIAIKATVSQYVGKPLTSWMDIPAIIRSPFLANATVTYSDNASTITNAPYDHSTNHDIYVRYSFVTPPSGGDYNVTLNAEYIYTSTTSGDANIYSKGSLIKDSETDDAANSHYQWALNYSDPYAMKIENIGKGEYIKLSSATPTNDMALSWNDEANATLFIAKQSAGNPGYYEVMLATGDLPTGDTYDAGDGVGITTTYFNIGRNISSIAENTVKLFQNTTYASGYNQLRFRLIGTEARDIVYHLIDKANNDLLQVTWRHTTEDEPYFPPRYRSPLVSTYYYWSNSACTTPLPNNKIGQVGDVYVTYDVNDLVDLSRGQLYLLKYENGDTFHQEDGGDGVNPTAQKAIYPYCNGDCNFFVYGQEQYELQQQGAASTRTRWAWYVDGGDNNDPYHVKIMSRQSETYSDRENNAYFRTCEVEYDNATHVVTTLAWPGISGVQATEYMVLGNEGQYQLVTTNEISGSRYTVNSFEQYWKTFDTIRKKVYGDKDAKAESSDPTTVPDVFATKDATSGQKLRDHLKNDLGWHSYEKWAYAKRWNGYNNADPPATSKGWEEIEHWYQTVNMGEGYFDFVETDINPVLILLDQHGWEIMRKPIPTSPTDPQRNAKYEAIRPYNSPMVKEYAFWATAKKRTGLHQYYQLKDRIGDNYTSSDLTSLPPYDSKNVHDKKGNLNDQYVTYIVKDEYALTYTPSSKTGKEFLIEQGSKYASTSDGTTITKNDVPAQGMQKHIADDAITDAEKWYVKPNWNIDYEMGYGDVSHDWGSNPNAYETDDIKNWLTADYINDGTLGQFSFSNGFDPYNIQIIPKSYSAEPTNKFMKTNATRAYLEDGVMHSGYESDPAISLDNIDPTLDKDNCVWFDGRKLSVTNATWMAVQDAEGNMQLMPRFDPNRRMSEFDELIAPTSADAAKTYTKLYRAEKYEYYIMDNSLNESLRYKSGGELKPQTPDHFKSPLAKDFTYYTDAECTNEITGPLDGVTLTGSKVYVRYEYDEEADAMGILKGNWLTMQLNEENTVYNSGIKQASEEKPSPVDADDQTWQWKFLESPQSVPDPYAVYIFNRSQSAGTKAIENSFALLSHTSGEYALAEAGLESYTYKFLNGDGGMSISQAATTANESGFTCSAGIFSDTNSHVKLTNDVEHTFTYKVYTNSGAFAISDTQTQEEVQNNDWIPRIPNGIKTPLLNLEQFRYYDKNKVTFGTGAPVPATDIASTDTIGKSLSYLYGLYDDEVVVHYIPYNPNVTEYVVPNVRNATGGTIAKGIGSNDTPLDLSQSLLYNVIWYNDNMMMTSNDVNVVGEANQTITTDKQHEWQIGGNDPYAITLYNVHAEKYITADDGDPCTLDDAGNATTFMLLPKDGYDYGMLAITGNEGSKLTITDDSNAGTDDAAKITTGDPAKFIFFALATHKVIYHLMIKNIGQKVIIPYKGTETNDVLVSEYRIQESGTTLRDLTSKDTTGDVEGQPSKHIVGDLYQLGETLKAIGERAGTTTGLFSRDSIYCYDAGHISLGDELEVPSVFYRPNVKYRFIVEGVYDATGASVIGEMNDKYKGWETENMGDDEGLLNNTVFVNIVYSFDADLGTNSGSGFVTSISDNKWYSFETNDETPQLAQYTTLEGLKTESGYATHYTNDYLWTPVGDPYGFKMYNRYAYKNRGETSLVMTTASIGNNVAVKMGAEASNDERDIYELIAISTTTPGYFRVHPMMNKSGVQYYINNDNGNLKLSTIPTEWTFGLSEDVMRPYYIGAGYVGGLNTAGKEAYETAAAIDNEFEKLTSLQEVVYNHDTNDDNNYIVHYAPGYYRLHSQPGSEGITTPRYLSGYRHKIELTAGAGSTAIPLHFYEQTSYDVNNPEFEDLGRAGTDFTETPATRGELPLSTVTNDPASIFHFTGAAGAAPTSTMQTQELYVEGNKMTKTAGEATTFNITDIGGAIVILHDGGSPANYLSYDQSSAKYDIKYGSAVPARTARWCMQPVQKGVTAGDGEMALTIATNDGKDNHYYATFYAPFDVLLTDADNDKAYVVPNGQWDTEIIYPKEIGEYNTGDYADNSQFIPAGTPVIIRSKNNGGTVTLALPNTTPSSAVSCVFSGQYLEQMLPHGSDNVYSFGLASTGTFEEDENFATNGLMTATLNTAGTELGFFKNANFDHESSAHQSNWALNNKYVYANKIYYRASGGGGGSRQTTRGVEFVPVIFDFEGEEPDEGEDGRQQLEGDNRIYDLQGRLVGNASERYNLSPGIYIVNGKKISVK